MAMPLERSTEDLRAALRQSAQHGTIGVKGIGGGARAWFLAHLLAETRQPLLAVLPTEEEAERLAADLRFFQNHAKTLGIPEAVSRAICLFPPWDLLPYESITPDPLLSGARLEALHLSRSDPESVLFASLKALLPRLLQPDALEAGTQKVAVGRALRLEEFIAGLARGGYRKVPLVSQVGDFSHRGHILDVFTPGREGSLRIELFGEEVEEIRLFDVDTQRSLTSLEEALILPARELPEDLSPRDLALQPLCAFCDYLPPETILLLVEPDQIRRQAERQAETIRRGHAEEALGSAGGGFPSPWSLYLSPEEVWSALSGPRPLILLDELGASLPAPTTREAPFAALLYWECRSAETLDVRVGPRRPLARAAEKIKTWQHEHRVFLASPNEGRAARLREILEEYGVERVAYLVGPLSRGFLLEQERILILTEEEIFGERVHPPSPPKRSRLSQLVSTFHALRAGDYVVHVEHGIAEYLGLQHLQVGGLEGDFLVLRFEGNDRLYVPPDKIDLVQKHTGPEGYRPRLDRLGGKAWERTKSKARKALREMAQELLDLYAARRVVEGHGFTPDSALSREFDAAFEYEETPDQLRAIEEVKADMEALQPMDRIVCGDVGYGKTEVAMRAAFKAVLDNKQVALLVPTTILAQQHWQTFTDRCKAFPVTIEMLSRFRSPKEQRAILRRAAEGGADIVIGTHRLLQKDVRFHDLGLVVVDEEHRFGVAHKETLKQIRKQVDVLTLTATPIPRTLHMSLSGIRDLSVIETPPEDRLAIQTFVMRFDRKVVREAILRERERGGQCYFVHNRVHSIDRIAAFLQDLVPEARFAVAHGQMREAVLEKVMLRFLRREVDVLVTTTIIESGLDIPTANTILVHHAERFGLAQLYQLRGRVGRSRHRAFAYLLVSEGKLLSEEARQRLRTLQELSELGAGFQIAARDLEIRGAGNILGAEQSGHMAAVGFELYYQLLEQAIQELKGEEIAPVPEPTLHLGIAAYLPETYIPDISQRLALYKRIAAGREEAELDALREEIRDRFGPLPPPALAILEIMEIKIHARRLCLSRIDVRPPWAELRWEENAPRDPDRLIAWAQAEPRRVQILPEGGIRLRLEGGDRLGQLKKSLQAVG